MKSKTYRIDKELAEEIKQMTVDYIKENDEIVSETKMINAILCTALKDKDQKNINECLRDCE